MPCRALLGQHAEPARHVSVCVYTDITNRAVPCWPAFLSQCKRGIRLGTHVSVTFSSDVKTLHVCEQQQIALGTKLVFHDILDSNRLVVVWITIRLDTHVSLTTSS